jgi:hypothetical protein
MIDTFLNLVFRCSHRRLTRPVTPAGKPGAHNGGAYVVCLDCGKQFSYDTKEMRMGKPIPKSHPEGVLHPDPPKEPPRKLRYALWASVPLAILAGIVMNGGKTQAGAVRKGKAEQAKTPAATVSKP